MALQDHACFIHIIITVVVIVTIVVIINIAQCLLYDIFIYHIYTHLFKSSKDQYYFQLIGEKTES